MSLGLGALAAALRDGLSERFFPHPIDGVERLARFVGQRSAYVAQTSLYGYLKTRMGTKFPVHFQDPAFAASIQAAAVRLFASCAADLTVHAVGGGGRARARPRRRRRRWRAHCYGRALGHGLENVEAGAVAAAAEAAFAARVDVTVWTSAARGEAAFAGSVEDLLRFAPVVEEFKDLDRPIVRNSIRFRWRDVRAQLARRLDAAAVGADWRARAGG